MKLIPLLFALLFIAPSLSFSKIVSDVNIPDTYKVGDKDLVLNGVGIRTKTFLRVKVYVGGFYMESKSSDPNTFLNDGKDKFIIMHFVRDVGKDKLVGGWNEAFNNAVKDQSNIKAQINEFNEFMSDIEENKAITIHFSNTGVEVQMNGKTKKIENAEFSKALLSVWFINAEDEDLRDGLLGKKSV